MRRSRQLLAIYTVAAAGLLLAGYLVSRFLLVMPARDAVVVKAEAEYLLDESTAGSVAVFGQRARLGAEGRVGGDALFMVEHEVEVAGTVDGNLTALSESVTLTGTVTGDAVLVTESLALQGDIAGDAIIVAESIVTMEGARVDGELILCVEDVDESTCDPEVIRGVISGAGSQIAGVSLVSLAGQGRWFGLLFPLPTVLLMTALSVLGVFVFPRRAHHLEAAVRSFPGMTSGSGLLLMLFVVGTGAGYVTLLAYVPGVALFLLPLFLLLFVGFGLLVIAGWGISALLVGNWLARRFTNTMIPTVVVTSAGGVLLSLITFALSWLPFGLVWVGLAVLLVGLSGMGAAFVTRFGGRSALPSRLATETPQHI